MSRRQLVGIVVSDALPKTRVVRVERLVRHPVYQRVVRHAKKFKVNDPESLSHKGDEVRIEETRPLSREKRWRLVEILRHGAEREDKEARRMAELEEAGVIRPKSASTPGPDEKA